MSPVLRILVVNYIIQYTVEYSLTSVLCC